MIKTKDGYAKLIGTKFTGDQYSLLKSDGNVWEVNKTINNEADKIVRTNSEGILPTDKISVKTEIQLSDKNANIYRVGSSGTISNGRDRALLKTTTYSSNSTLYSIKTTSGSWDMSVYSNKLNLHFINDDYYTGDSSEFITLTFPEKTGTLALTSNIPVIDIIAGVSKAVSSSSIRDPYIIVTSKIEDVLKNLGQIRLQGVGSTVINSNTSDSIIVSSTLYKAGTGLQEISTDAASITGYKTTTMSVKLDFITTNDKYAVQSNSYGLYVQVPWRTIKINGTSIQRNELNLVGGNNITLQNSSGEVTISAIDTIYKATDGIKLEGDYFKHINSVIAKTTYGSTGTTASANGGVITLTDVQYDKHGHITKSVDRNITLSQDHTKTSPSQGTAGTKNSTSGSTLDIPYIDVNSNGHITGYGIHRHTITGFLTSERYTGTVTSITPGIGLTGTYSDDPITSSGTINLKTTTTTEIGGIKIGYVESDKKYSIKLDGNDKAYVEVPWEDTDTWRPITNSYNGTNATTSLSQKGAKQLYDDLCDLIPSDLTETGSSYWPIYIDSYGDPTQCSSKYHGSLHFTSGSSGTVYCYQFGPIVILQGHIRNIDTTKTNVSNYLFTLPDSCPAPQDVMGFAIVQRNGYENDRNTVIRINTSGIGYVDPYYSDYSINGDYSKYGYYLQVCYII